MVPGLETDGSLPAGPRFLFCYREGQDKWRRLAGLSVCLSVYVATRSGGLSGYNNHPFPSLVSSSSHPPSPPSLIPFFFSFRSVPFSALQGQQRNLETIPL